MLAARRLNVTARRVVVCNTQALHARHLPPALKTAGATFGADTTWRGVIDEVRVWAVARTQKEIQSTMNRYLCGDEPGLRAYWLFDEGRGSEFRNAAGHSDGVFASC